MRIVEDMYHSCDECRRSCSKGNFRPGLIKLHHLALELRQRAVTFFVKRVYIHPIRNKAEQWTLLNYPPLRIASIKQSNSPETIYDSAIVEWQRRDPRLGWVARAITVFPSARVFSGEKLFKKRKKQLLDGSVTLLLVQEWNAKILFSSLSSRSLSRFSLTL